MGDQVTAAAKALARWCYDRGVDERVLAVGEQLLGYAVDQALGRRDAPPVEHALWEQVATLLRRRRAWDTAHQITPPPAAECLRCAIASPACPTHAPGRCRICHGPMHRSIRAEGYDTHPCCDRSPGTQTYTDLECVTQLLGATLLAEPA